MECVRGGWKYSPGRILIFLPREKLRVARNYAGEDESFRRRENATGGEARGIKSAVEIIASLFR